MENLNEEAKQACVEIYQSWSKENVQRIGHSVVYAWNLGQRISKQPLHKVVEDGQSEVCTCYQKGIVYGCGTCQNCGKNLPAT